MRIVAFLGLFTGFTFFLLCLGRDLRCFRPGVRIVQILPTFFLFFFLFFGFVSFIYQELI